MEFMCANARFAWVKIREMHPHFFFGLRFLNNTKTDVCLLTRDELIAKYREMLEMCERNLKKDSARIEEFKRLDIRDEEDLIKRCLHVSLSDTLREIDRMIKEEVDRLNAEVTPNVDEPTRPENASNRYGMQDVHNWFINFVPVSVYVNAPPNNSAGSITSGGSGSGGGGDSRTNVDASVPQPPPLVNLADPSFDWLKRLFAGVTTSTTEQ